jgi:integrase
VAKAWLRDLELGTTNAAPHQAKALKDAVKDMIALKREVTAGAYRGHAGHLYRLLGENLDIHNLTRSRVADYAVGRLKEGASRHTVQKELVVLRQALKEAKARNEYSGQVDVVPPWKAEYEPETRWLTPDEFGRLLSAVTTTGRRTWFMIQAYTGAELGAMKRMAASPRGGWEFVNLQRGTITIPGTKRSSRYRVDMPLHPALLGWLKKLSQTCPLVTPWTKVHRDLKEACKRAKIDPPATTHDLRRTFGSWLVQAGVDLHHVARLMGNTPGMVARVYGQTSDASYSAAIAHLPRLKRIKKASK